MKKFIITTTINEPTEATIKFCEIADEKGFTFVIVGDTKTPHEMYDNLVKDYFNSISLVNINSLENIAINVLLQYKGLVKENNYKDFIEQNKEIISKWSDKLDSLTIFNAYIVNSDLLRDYAKTFPKNDTKDLTGVNFLSLLKHERFYSFYNKLNENVNFYTHYFDDYMFRGKNLFSFWGNLNNPMFLLTLAISQGKNKDYITAKEQDKELIKNVTSI